MPDRLSVPERSGTVGEPPLILGYAGLLPQVTAAATCFFDAGGDLGGMFAFGYAALILSFVGGIWWGFAMNDAGRQGRIATCAVLPSLVAALLILLSIVHLLSLAWALVILGAAVMLTLLIDRALVVRGCAPRGWMALRIPLSIGLGSLTILCGILCGTMGSAMA